MDIPLIAGTVSTVVFAISNLPMLGKALRTRDVSSYSLPSMVMINAANAVYWLYVFSLPLGPIWALHTFYVVSCAIMLVLCASRRAAVRDLLHWRTGARSRPLRSHRRLAHRSVGTPRARSKHTGPRDAPSSSSTVNCSTRRLGPAQSTVSSSDPGAGRDVSIITQGSAARVGDSS